MLMINIEGDLPDQLIQIIGGQRVRDFDMNGAVVGIRAVIVQDQVMDSADLRIAADSGFDIF